MTEIPGSSGIAAGHKCTEQRPDDVAPRCREVPSLYLLRLEASLPRSREQTVQTMRASILSSTRPTS